MGKRGPAPKSTNLKILEGNPGKRPLNHAEPQPDTGAICPDWLSDDAKQEWQRLAPVLEACGILTKADQNTLAAYCESFTNYKLATIAINELGFIQTDSKGRRIAPEVTAQRTFADQMVKFGTKLGLSPSDRTALKITAPKQKSKWQTLTK